MNFVRGLKAAGAHSHPPLSPGMISRSVSSGGVYCGDKVTDVCPGARNELRAAVMAAVSGCCSGVSWSKLSRVRGSTAEYGCVGAGFWNAALGAVGGTGFSVTG